MRRSTRVRRTLAAFAAAALVITGTLTTASAANAAVPIASVTKMASLGDSITTALMSCTSLLAGCPANSWSTGTNTAVVSHLQRINAANGALPAPTGYNYAVTGALAAALPAQAVKAANQKVQYVTIEIGANDACTKTTALMTSKESFRGSINAALTSLANTTGGAPQVFVASIPNLDLMRTANAGKASARLTWGLLKVCQSLLANPTSNAPADLARRAEVMKRVNEYNVELKAACESDAFKAFCKYDNGATYLTAFSAAHISTKDYFHPSVSGQALLAQRTWAAGVGLTP